MNVNRLDDRIEAAEVARQLGIATTTVYGWRFSGRFSDRLTFFRTGRNRLYCDRAQFEEFKEFYLGGEVAPATND